eukprot:2230262-Amphidinium_carterae.1
MASEVPIQQGAKHNPMRQMPKHHKAFQDETAIVYEVAVICILLASGCCTCGKSPPVPPHSKKQANGEPNGHNTAPRYRHIPQAHAAENTMELDLCCNPRRAWLRLIHEHCICTWFDQTGFGVTAHHVTWSILSAPAKTHKQEI